MKVVKYPFPTLLLFSLFLLFTLLIPGCSSAIHSLENPNAISLEEERQLGQKVVTDLEKEKEILSDPVIDGYLLELGDRLASGASIPYPYPFTLKVIKDDTLNAFALPGGFIYLHSGLIAKMDNEAQLASVVAHEMGHVTYRHAAARISAIQNYNLLTTVGILIAGGNSNVSQEVRQGIRLFGTGSILAYSREQEAEADSEGLKIAYRTHYDMNEMLGMFSKLKELEKDAPSDLDRFFSDHPLTDDRLKETRKAISELPPQDKSVKNSKAFDEFKKKVVKLTAPKEEQGKKE